VSGLVGVLLALAGVGIPLFVALAGLTMLGYSADETDLSTLIIEMNDVASAPALVAIPLFTFAGYVMAESGTPNRLVKVARALVGWMPGGLAIVSVVACAFFTAFTGASGITIIALGGLLFPILRNEGFPERFSLGLLTSGGSLGLLFPPSLPVILYAIIASGSGPEPVEVDKLFAAALIPGALLVLFMGVYSAFVGLRTPDVQQVKFSVPVLLEGLKEARYELPLPIIILWGIYGGWLTVNEAATLTVLIVLVVECLLYRDLSFTKDIPRIAVKSTVLVGAILMILGVALGLTNFLVLEEVPDKILEYIQANVDSKVGFLISLNLFLLVVGCLLDIFSAIIVVVPLILPLAAAYDVNPYHLGVIFLTNLEIGYMTPPVGMNLFLSAFRFKKPLPTLYIASIPFIVVLLLALGVITYVPELSLWMVGE
jgi:C4-dicarboxylate transporter DctM subunit